VNHERKFFTPAERLWLVTQLAEEDEVLKSLKSNQVTVLPINDPLVQTKLSKQWVFKAVGIQPIHEIRDYFGEEIAFYFSFLGVYTTWLALPAALGILTYIHQSLHGFATVPTFLFSVFLAVWATLFLEHWKRREKTLGYEWGCLDWEEKEIEDAHVDHALEKGSAMAKVRIVIGYIFSVSLIGFALLTGVILMGFLLHLDTFAQMHWKGPEWSHGIWAYAVYFPNIALSVCISFYKSANKSLAAFTTKLEQRKTDLERREALVTKLAVFNFVNYYAALIHTAFVKRDLIKLRKTLITLLVVQQVIGQVAEIGVPLAVGAIRYWKSEQQDEKKASNSGVGGEGEKISPSANTDHRDHDLAKQAVLERAKKELALEEYAGVFDDYLELWVQMGQVCLFSSVFPLAALVALVNNVVEIRTDAFKIVHASRRCQPSKKSGIGSWLPMFDFLGYAAVITNVSLIGLVILNSKETMAELSTGFGLSELSVLLLLVGAEHLLLGFKTMLSFLIPDVPDDIKIKLRLAARREEFIRAKALEQRSKLRHLFGQFKSLDGLKAVVKPTTAKDEPVSEALIAFVNEQTLARSHAEVERERLEREVKRMRANLANNSIGVTAILVNVTLALLGGFLLLAGR